MGKRADTEALAGAKRAGVSKAPDSRAAEAPELKLVTSAKRQTILEGMLEAVGAEGYEHTSVRTVLARTGVYRQAFYDNFADKDDCYLQAYDLGVGRIEAVLVEAAAGKDSWTEQLRAGLKALLDFLDAEPDIARALVVEVHTAGGDALAKRAAAMQRLTDFIDGARAAAAEQGESPPPIAPEGVTAGIQALIHSRLAAKADGSFHELLPEFMYFAVLPYFGAQAASTEMRAGTA